MSDNNCQGWVELSLGAILGLFLVALALGIGVNIATTRSSEQDQLNPNPETHILRNPIAHVQVLYLNDGTRCVAYRESITCDWGQRRRAAIEDEYLPEINLP